MSHLITINIELRNMQAVKAACNRLKWEVKENAKITYHDGAISEGMAIYIPEWRYPIVITDDGTIKGDNYGGHWGDPASLNTLKQAYGVEAARLILMREVSPRKYLYITETENRDGSITLTARC